MVCGVVNPHFVIIWLVLWKLLITFLCRADHDVWMRKSRNSYGTECYDYMLLYANDFLAISEAPKEAVLHIDKFFKMKPNSIAPSDIYLGCKVKKIRLPNMVKAWTFSSSQYVQGAVSNVETFLQYLDGYIFSTNTNNPLSNNYRPVMDSSPELDGVDGDYYQSFIGILWWIVELSRIDI